MAMTFPARSILSLDGVFLSEHSRSPLTVEFEKIENANRTVNGRLRVYEIANKHKLNVDWEWIPSKSQYTVDGYAGGVELNSLYLLGGVKTVEIWTDSEAAKSSLAPTVSFDGRINSFNYSIEKRNVGGIFFDYWNISMSVEEF
jgi:coproporphyrinogen III oxidase